MELIIFIGIQGAGKSSFYKQFFADSHIRLNGDMLKTKHREQLLFDACLASKTPTVIDKTNATIEERQRYILPALSQHFKIIAYYFDVAFDDALARNNQRTGKAKIPEIGLKATAKKMQQPTFAESFSQIFYVTLADNQFFVKEIAQHEQERP